MTCRRVAAAAAADDDDHHADVVISPTHQHISCARSPPLSPHAAAPPRIWSIVELIQSDNNDQRTSSDTDLVHQFVT